MRHQEWKDCRISGQSQGHVYSQGLSIVAIHGGSGNVSGLATKMRQDRWDVHV
jgi:hypothetical protein